MNTLLNKDNAAETSESEHQAFRVALRALRPPAQPSDALDERVRILAQTAQQRMEKRRRVRQMTFGTASLCALTICAANSPRLWAQYQLFQIARRVASAPSVRATIVRTTPTSEDRRELTVSGDDAAMQSEHLTLTRREGEINYWDAGSSPTNLSSPSIAGSMRILPWTDDSTVAFHHPTEDLKAHYKNVVSQLLTLDFLSPLRQASAPVALSRTAYRLTNWTTAGGKIASATLEDGDGHLLNLLLDSRTGLPTSVVEQASADGKWSQVSQTLSYPGPMAEGWVESMWKPNPKRIWRARRLSMQALLGGGAATPLSQVYTMFQQDDDIFVFYTNNPVMDRVPQEQSKWDFVVNGTPLVLVHRSDTRFLMPDENGLATPLLINGQVVRVLWFTPLSSLHLEDGKVAYFSLKGCLSPGGRGNRFVSTSTGNRLFSRIPYQMIASGWQQSLLGGSAVQGSQEKEIKRRRDKARQGYLSSHSSGR